MNETAAKSRNRREIVVVNHYYDAHGGGIERAVRHLIEALVGNGKFHFTWVASEEKPKPVTIQPEPVINEKETDAETGGEEKKSSGLAGQTILPMKSWNFLEKLCGVPWPIWGWKSLRKLHAAIRKADLVWLHDAPYMGNIIAFRMARKAKKPVVITQHIGTIPYRSFIFRKLMEWGDKIFTRRMLERAQQTVFISDRIAEIYHRKIAFTSPVMIVPNGVDPAIFHPVPSEQRWQIRAKFALKDDQPVLIFVGRFTEKKGLAVIERLTRLLPEWRFWLVGQGPINPEAWYRPNVHVFHERSGAALAELYHAADLLVLPSYGEGFPLVIQEAMACGLPVMCSPETAAGSQLARPFLLTSNVDPFSPEQTTTTWLTRLKAQREYLPVAQANQDLANAAHYFWSWPKIADCYAAIFDNLIKRRKT